MNNVTLDDRYVSTVSFNHQECQLNDSIYKDRTFLSFVETQQ